MWTKIAGFLVAVVVLAGCAAEPMAEEEGSTSSDLVGDVVTMNRNDDGTFSVVCMDASTNEVYTEPSVSQQQILANDVCSRGGSGSTYSVEYYGKKGCQGLVAVGKYTTNEAHNDAVCAAQGTSYSISSVKYAGQCHDLYFKTPQKSACELVRPFRTGAVSYYNTGDCTGPLVAAYSFPASTAGEARVCENVTTAMSSWDRTPYVVSASVAGKCYPFAYKLDAATACKLASVQQGTNVVGFFNDTSCTKLIGTVDATNDPTYATDRCQALASVTAKWQSNPYVVAVTVDGVCTPIATRETIGTACPRFAH